MSTRAFACLAFMTLAACAHSDPSRLNDPMFETTTTQEFTYGAVRPANAASHEFRVDVLPPFGAALGEPRSPGFMMSGLPAGEKLFGARTISGVDVYCTTREVRLGDIRSCFMDANADGAFEIACSGAAFQVGRGKVYPEGFPLAVSVITTCSDQNPALRYTKLADADLPRGEYRFWFEPSRSGGAVGRAGFVLANGGAVAWDSADVALPENGAPARLELGDFVFQVNRSGDKMAATLVSMPGRTN